MSGLVRVLKDKAPVLVFSSLCAGAAYAVYYAHHQQIAEKKVRFGSIRPVVQHLIHALAATGDATRCDQRH
ncbi:hypothetical protein V7S43_012052 [Phytophthora oleae]|uniref:HIG1 domain-containing protein n=1 Tax=Phytophthora oleae TaxID=2107226 RepID=A0ABD3FAY5_9STRA